MPKLNQVGVAILGCGYWGKNLVRNFYELGVLKLICDVSFEGRAKAQTLAPDVECSSVFKDAFNHPKVNAIVIATPATTHESLSMQALDSGKDIYVEKPLAMTVAQGERIQAQASKNKNIIMVGHILEYHPAVIKLKSLIRSGELGRVQYIFSNRLNFGKIRTEENALWSFASHDIAVILRLLNADPIEVTSVGGNYVTPNLADVTVSCLRFHSGQRAHIFVSWLNPFKEQKMVVVGERKMAVFNDISESEKLLLYNQRVDASNTQPLLQKGDIHHVQTSQIEPLKEECLHFINCIKNRETPLTDVNSGISVLRVLEACQISMKYNGKPIALK